MPKRKRVEEKTIKAPVFIQDLRRSIAQQLLIYLPNVLCDIIMEYYLHEGDVVLILKDDLDVEKKRYYIDNDILHIITMKTTMFSIKSIDIITNKHIKKKVYVDDNTYNVIEDGTFVIKNNILYGISIRPHPLGIRGIIKHDLKYMLDTVYNYNWFVDTLKIDSDNAVTVCGRSKEEDGYYNQYPGLKVTYQYISQPVYHDLAAINFCTEPDIDHFGLVDNLWTCSLNDVLLDYKYKELIYRNIYYKDKPDFYRDVYYGKDCIEHKYYLSDFENVMDAPVQSISVFMGSLCNKACIMLTKKNEIRFKFYDIQTNKCIIENTLCIPEYDRLCIWSEQLISVHRKVNGKESINLYHILYE